MTTQQKLLHLLADGQIHSGEELARTLGLSRAAIWKQMRQLEELDISISAQPGQGYQLSQPLDFLSGSEIEAGLNAATREAATTVQVLWVTESTSRVLSALEAPAPGRFQVCAAEYQTAGKGRRGRQWLAPFGAGICLSVSWSFATSPPSLACLGLAVGVGLLRALCRVGVAGVQLKWPNDILLSGRKLAGILIEVQGESEGPLHAIIGIGINYRISAEVEQEIITAGGLEPAAILSSDRMSSIGRNEIVALVIDELHTVLAEFARSGFTSFVAEWQAADYLNGKQISVTSESGLVVGTARGVSADGQLKIASEQGVQQVLSGDVKVRAVV